MPDTPPQSPPLPPPQSPNQPPNLDPQNPNLTSDFVNPSDNHEPSTPQTQDPPAQIPDNTHENENPDRNLQEEPQVVSDDQEQEDPEVEQEGMNITHSPRNQSSISDTLITLEVKGSNPSVTSARRAPKRKKGFGKNYKSKVALEKKLQGLSKGGFNPIAFVPGKNLVFTRFEELLKKLGLWDFAHIEFDRNLRADLIANLVVTYASKHRGSYVNGCKIGVNRADLGRALKLPGKKPGGDCDLEKYPEEFISFLEDFVSYWMLLHEDFWCMPNEIVNWIKLIREGHPQKVDWAGLVWYMVEKELAQGSNLKDCYYASHLQQLIKVQRESLLRGDTSVETVEEDEDEGDVKMLDAEESSMVGVRSKGQNVELMLGQDRGASADNVGNVDKLGQDFVALVDYVGNVDKMDMAGDAEEVEKVGDVDKAEKVGDADKMDNVEDADEAENVDAYNSGSLEEFHKVEKVESAEYAENVGAADEHTENANDLVENADNVCEHGENVTNVENAIEESKDIDMLDFGFCKGDEQGQWLLDGKNEGGQHFLQRCGMANVKVSGDDRRQGGIGEVIEDEDEDDEEDGSVEGFKIMQKGPLDAMPSANLMQAFESGQLPYNSAELGGQSSLELMSSKAENNVMLGGPSMFNHAAKREIGLEHDISHHASNDSHKKMRVDGSWEQKPPDYRMCMEQGMQWFEKAKMAFEANEAELYQRATMTEQIMAHQIEAKNAEILQLKFKLDDLQRRKQMEIHHRDRELYLMNSVIEGYRKALKESQRAFAEFRKRYAVRDEPIYRDAGSGGVVKSIMELEKERIKQEEEKKMMCYLLEETYKKHIISYEMKWDELVARVQYLNSRLQNAGKEVELLKELFVERKSSGSAPNEP